MSGVVEPGVLSTSALKTRDARWQHLRLSREHSRERASGSRSPGVGLLGRVSAGRGRLTGLRPGRGTVRGTARPHLVWLEGHWALRQGQAACDGVGGSLPAGRPCGRRAPRSAGRVEGAGRWPTACPRPAAPPVAEFTGLEVARGPASSLRCAVGVSRGGGLRLTASVALGGIGSCGPRCGAGWERLSWASVHSAACRQLTVSSGLEQSAAGTGLYVAVALLCGGCLGVALQGVILPPGDWSETGIQGSVLLAFVISVCVWTSKLLLSLILKALMVGHACAFTVVVPPGEPASSPWCWCVREGGRKAFTESYPQLGPLRRGSFLNTEYQPKSGHVDPDRA